jgi:hypothetical protein
MHDSNVALPLTNLIQQNAGFDWSSDCKQAFQKLKTMVLSAPLVITPDPENQFLSLPMLPFTLDQMYFCDLVLLGFVIQ